MTHCRGEAVDKSYAGSSASNWYVLKDGVEIDAITTQVGDKVRVQVDGDLIQSGSGFTIYNDSGNPVETYELVDC